MSWLLSLLGLAKANRKMLTILLALAVGSAFYVQWQFAALSASRAATAHAKLLGYSDAVCGSLGVPLPAPDADAETRGAFAAACQAEAGRLGAIEGDLATGSLDTVLDAMARQHGKEQVDAALAAAMSKRTADAVAQMEAANAAIEDDRVGSGWAAAVNELGGVRR